MEISLTCLLFKYTFLFVLPASTIWFLWVMVICMILVAYRFFRSSLNTAGDRIVALEQEKRALQDQLESVSIREHVAKTEAEKAGKTKKSLLSSLSHEIRTPMNGVLGMATLLEETELNREQREYTETIKSSGQTLLNKVNEILISDILELSKIDAFGVEPEQKNVDLINCIEEVLETFAVKAAEVETELLYDIDADVPPQIISDNKRLQQVLINLVENALKFTSGGEIFVKVYMVNDEQAPLLTLGFEVIDTGIGISNEVAGKLFTGILPSGYSTKNKSSKGLGLVICRKLVEQLGGEIDGGAAENGGSRFSFNIKTYAVVQPATEVASYTMPGYEGQQVLIVHQNPEALNILSKLLERWKLIPVTASSGKQALEILSQVSFNLVILDVKTADADSIQLSQTIREQHPSIPQLLLKSINDTLSSEPGEFSRAVLNKPVRQHLLFDNIMSQLRHGTKEADAGQLSTRKLSENFSQKYPLRIMVAEDNPVNQKWITKILNKMGYHPAIAENGKIVLEMVGHEEYDMILMDVQMPAMDGLEATKMIRLCLDKQPIVIAMTANVMHGDRQACIQAGMNDYISKPVELNELVNMLEKWALVIKEKK